MHRDVERLPGARGQNLRAAPGYPDAGPVRRIPPMDPALATLLGAAVGIVGTIVTQERQGQRERTRAAEDGAAAQRDAFRDDLRALVDATAVSIFRTGRALDDVGNRWNALLNGEIEVQDDETGATLPHSEATLKFLYVHQEVLGELRDQRARLATRVDVDDDLYVALTAIAETHRQIDGSFGSGCRSGLMLARWRNNSCAIRPRLATLSPRSSPPVGAGRNAQVSPSARDEARAVDH
jgi:hypothetical protein